MEAEQQEPEFSELKSIDRYFWVLVEAYPEPINQTEIAKRANVTRAAVSQARDELIKICDLKSLAYEKKLLLKKDSRTGLSLLGYLIWADTPDNLKKYISSNYFDDIFKEPELFEKISENAGEYDFDKYFSRNDFEWIWYFIKNKLISHEPEIVGNIVYYEVNDDISKQYILANLPLNIQFIYSALFDKSLSFLNKKEDFIKLLELRDKLWFFIVNNKKICEVVLIEIKKWLEFEEDKKDESVDKILEMLLLRIIKKLFKNFSLYIYKEANEVDLQIDEKYYEIGELFNV